MIKAVIFDMDGLLIDSEPLWQEAEMAIFRQFGVPLTPEMSTQTMGLRVDEVVQYWHTRYPWDNPDIAAVARRIDQAVIDLVAAKGEPKAGAIETIASCKALGLPLAIASSSSNGLIAAVLQKLGVEEDIRVIHSAHDEEYGKPHPAVYISTATALGIHPNDCLAFEDSPNGVLAAKAAKMRCIAVPEPEYQNDKRFGIADIIIPSLRDFTAEMLQEWQ